MVYVMATLPHGTCVCLYLWVGQVVFMCADMRDSAVCVCVHMPVCGYVDQ